MNDFQKYLSLELQKADRNAEASKQAVKNYQRELADLQTALTIAEEQLSAANYMAVNQRRVYEAEMRRDPTA